MKETPDTPDDLRRLLAELGPSPWIDDLIDEYWRTGRVDLGALARVVGHPMQGVDLTDPLASVRKSDPSSFAAAALNSNPDSGRR